MSVVAVGECGVSVHQSVLLICAGKQQQQQQQPCLRGPGPPICQVFCIYSPLENSLSSSVDGAAALLVMPTFSKLSSVLRSGQAFLRGGRLIAPPSQVLSVGRFSDTKSGSRFCSVEQT